MTAVEITTSETVPSGTVRAGESPTTTPSVPSTEAGGGPAVAGCCSLPRTPVDAPTAELMAARFKALSDPMRLRLMSHIAARGCDSVCACDLLEVVDLSQPTISHHLRKLVDADLLTRVQRGKWAYYSVVHGAFDELRRFLDLA